MRPDMMEMLLAEAYGSGWWSLLAFWWCCSRCCRNCWFISGGASVMLAARDCNRRIQKLTESQASEKVEKFCTMQSKLATLHYFLPQDSVLYLLPKKTS